MKRSILIASGVMFLLVLTATGASKSPCQSINKWVAAHVEARTLPSTFEEVNKLPMSLRRAVFSALSPDQKRDLMLEQVRAFKASRTFTPDQVRVLDRAVAFIQTVYHRPVKEARKDPVMKEIDRFFPKEPAFGVLGVPLAPSPFTVAKSGYTSASASMPLTCECSLMSDWCSGQSTCENLGCDIPWHGCGTLLLYECNGLCYAGCPAGRPCPARG